MRSRLWGLLFVALVVAAAMLGGGPRQLAQAQTEEAAGVRHLVVTLNKSRTLRFDQPFSSAVNIFKNAPTPPLRSNRRV